MIYLTTIIHSGKKKKLVSFISVYLRSVGYGFMIYLHRPLLPPASVVEVIESFPCLHVSVCPCVCQLVSALTAELFDMNMNLT